MLLPSLHWLYESSRSPQRLPGILVDGGANVGRATARQGAKFSNNPVNFFFVGLVETHFFHRRCLWISPFFLEKFWNPDPPNKSGTFFFFLRWTICLVWGYLQGLRLEFELPTTIFRFRNCNKILPKMNMFSRFLRLRTCFWTTQPLRSFFCGTRWIASFGDSFLDSKLDIGRWLVGYMIELGGWE